MNRPMWFAKFAAVMVYHYWLTQVLGSWEAVQDFKFYSFLIVTPIVKFFFPFKGCPTDRSRKEFALSVLGDTVQCLLLWKVILVYCRGGYFFLYPFAQAFTVLGLEYLTFMVLDARSEDPAKRAFVAKVSQNPLDYMLMSLVSLVNYCVGLSITDFDLPITGLHVAGLGLSILQGDLSFGILHYLSHKVPRFWASHKVHHEYKKQDLNTLANFYSDLPDGISMNCGLIGAGILAHAFGGPFGHQIVHMEYLFPALYTHSKYPTTFCNYIYFYELDVLSMVFREQRTAEYHHHHHQDSSAHFSVYGVWPDWLIKKMVDPFLSSSLKKEKKAE
jgi:sterol desaturase/sphingolipid hydroxylase (fatty acid hydroxylase superfamily)